MIDYDKPWGWAQPQQQKNNTLAPLGSNQEGAPAPVMGAPSAQDQALKQVGGALATKAVDGAVKGVSDYNAASKAADVLSTSDIGVGAAAAGGAADALPVLGPLGAAIGGAMKGEYDQAAGSALGSVLGAYFGPLGSMAGGKLGGMAGNAVGSVFGLADGITKVPDQKKESFVESIWNKVVNKGAEAVKASTGNSGGIGQAKQALVSRKDKLDAAEKEALGYAWGTSNVGGKGMGGGAPSYGYAGRPFGSTAPTGYYGDTSTAGTRWRPNGFTAVNQQAPIAATPQNPTTGFQPGSPIWGGGVVSGGTGGDGVGGVGAASSAGDASSGSGIGNGAEGDSAGPGGDAGAGGGGSGGGK